jgi:hypothetical protein
MEKIQYLFGTRNMWRVAAWCFWAVGWAAIVTSVESFSPYNVPLRPSSSLSQQQRRRRQQRYHDLSCRTRETPKSCRRRYSYVHRIRSAPRDETDLENGYADIVDPETLRSVTFCNLPKDQGTIECFAHFVLLDKPPQAPKLPPIETDSAMLCPLKLELPTY